MKMFVVFSFLIAILPFQGYSQNDTTKGIAFVHDLSWQQILQKAKTENKYIFVDCYTTWCGPCKIMDKKVYPSDTAGSYINDKFISVRVQMDTTQQDNEEIQRWYSIAQTIGKQYYVGGYPFYIFFSPDGQAVHKNMGSMDINDFLSMAHAAMDPDKQYYTLRAHYRQGDLKYTLMPVLANVAKRVQQDSLSTQVTRDYVHHYLELLPEEKMWTKENILLVNGHPSVVGYHDRIFRSYCHNAKFIDSVMENHTFVDGLINAVAYRDIIKSNFGKANDGREPNWHHLENQIAKRCGDFYARKNVLQGRVEYYKNAKKWHKYIKYFIRQEEEDSIENWQLAGVNILLINNAAYEVFQYSNNKRELIKALSWVNRCLSASNSPYPEGMDTKANILYKLGRKEEGLDLEEQAHALVSKASLSYADIQSNYEKMKNGQPTWISPAK